MRTGYSRSRERWCRQLVRNSPGRSITLEMFNLGKVPVELRAGIDKPAQLMLLPVSTPLKKQELYGQGEQDKFQYQDSPIPRKK